MPRTCPPNTIPYTVRRRDNLFAIARSFNTTIREILLANPQINTFSMLRVGDVLCIPVRRPVVPPCPGGRQYTVRPGETLNTIAAYFGVTVNDLLRANPGIDPRGLFIGQVICIPTMTPPVFRCPPNTVEYIIRPGDTLAILAREYNTTVGEILRLNPRIVPGRLRIGDRICLPRISPRPGPRPRPRPGPGPGPGMGPGPGQGPETEPMPGQRPGIGPGPGPGSGPMPGERPGIR